MSIYICIYTGMCMSTLECVCMWKHDVLYLCVSWFLVSMSVLVYLNVYIFPCVLFVRLLLCVSLFVFVYVCVSVCV